MSMKTILSVTVTLLATLLAGQAQAQDDAVNCYEAAETAFERLDCELVTEQKKREIARVKQERAEIAGAVGGAPIESPFPELVRAIGKAGQPDSYEAEFRAGRSSFVARVGDTVAPGWKLTRFLSSGVELRSNNGQTTILRVTTD